MRTSTRSIVLGLFLAGMAGTTFAQDQPPDMVTDRPDRTESANIVQPGYVLVELGYLHIADEQTGVEIRSDTLPETLVRVGLTRAIELRLGYEGYRWFELKQNGTTVQDVQGSADAAVGAKFALNRPQEHGPEMAILSTISLPVGVPEFTTNRADTKLFFVYGQSLGEKWSIGSNVGVSWETQPDATGEDDTLSAFNWTAVGGYSVSDRVGLYAELYGRSGLSEHGPPPNGFDGGVTWMVRDNLQLDALAGVGLSETAVDWFAGFGVSFRLPR